MTYKGLILKTLEVYPESTCAFICRQIPIYLNITISNKRALSSTISSVLKKMVTQGILRYGMLRGPQDGKTYIIT